MASGYPTVLDTSSTFPTDVTDDTDSKAGTPRTGLKGFLAQWVDDMGDAMVKVQTELGVLPKGANATSVADRLDQGEKKPAVKAASTGNIVINPGGTTLTVDGVSMANTDRLLLKDETVPATNGIYVVGGVGSSVTLTRATDFDTAIEVADQSVAVQQGTLNGDTQWRQTTSAPITLGTTALRFSRFDPTYPPLQRNPWEVGATPPPITNMNRDQAEVSCSQTVITAMTSLHGGMILRAGTVYTNINAFCTATGAGAVTLNHFSIVRQSDLTVLQRTANITALPSLGVSLRALQATLTVHVDTPVWIMWSTQVATTSPAYAGMGILTALVQPLGFQAPIQRGNTSTVPTSTPHVVGSAIAAPTTATTPLVYFWLT